MTLPFESGLYASPFGGSPFSSSLGNTPFTRSTFKPTDKTSFSLKALPFQVVGTDLVTGKRDVNILSGTRMPDGTPFVATQADYEGGGKPSTGDVDKELERWIKYRTQTLPLNLAEMQAAAGVQSALTRQQIRDIYPFVSAATAEATARNLAASQAYRAFAEQLPSSVQNIMASKQGQMLSAQTGEAALQRATADQLRAAKESQGRFAGQYIQFG